MPKDAIQCINTWRNLLPDYDIIEWNESNFDLNMFPYVKEAYENQKFAFVSDVARLYVLYHHGGIYMDTDIEVIKSLDPFLNNIAFIGYEDGNNIQTGIIGSEKGGKWVKQILESYHGRHFVKEDGTLDTTTNVSVITDIMLSYGLEQNNTLQDFPHMITVYPKDYFCAKSYIDGKIHQTPRTVTIHHFSGSWLSTKQKVRIKISLILRKLRIRIPNKIKRLFKF